MAETNCELSQTDTRKNVYTLEKLTSSQQGKKCFAHCRAQVSSGQRGDIFLPNVGHSLVNISCVVCKKVFPNYTDWDAHADQMLREEDSEHGEIFKIQKVVSKESAGSYEQIVGEFSCEMCNKSFSQIGELQDHISNNFSYVQLICSQCGGQFCNIDSHFPQHSKEQYCGECGKSFVELKTHVKDFHRGFLSVLVLNTTSCGGTKGTRFLKQIMIKTGLRFMPEEIQPAETQQQQPQMHQKRPAINDFFSSFDPFSGQERQSIDSSVGQSVIMPSKTNSQSAFSENTHNTLFASPPPGKEPTVPSPPSRNLNGPSPPPPSRNLNGPSPPPRKKDSSLPWDHAIRPQPSSLTLPWDRTLLVNPPLKEKGGNQSHEKEKSKGESEGDKSTTDTSLHENLQEVVEAVGEKIIKLEPVDGINNEPLDEINKELPVLPKDTHDSKTVGENDADKNTASNSSTENLNRSVSEKVPEELVDKNIKLEPIDDAELSSQIDPQKELVNSEQKSVGDAQVKTNVKLETTNKTLIKTVNPPKEFNIDSSKIQKSFLNTRIKTEVDTLDEAVKNLEPKEDANIDKKDIEAIKKQTIKTLTAAKLNKIKDPNLLKQVKSMIMQLKSKIGPNDKSKQDNPVKTEPTVTTESTEVTSPKDLPDLNKPPSNMTDSTDDFAKPLSDQVKSSNYVDKIENDVTKSQNDPNEASNVFTKPPNRLPGLSFDEVGKRIWAFEFPSSSKIYVCEFCGFQSVEESSTTKFDHMIKWHFNQKSQVKVIDNKHPEIEGLQIDKWTKDALEELSVEGSSLRENTLKDIIEKHQVENAMHAKDGRLIQYKLVPNSSETSTNFAHGPSNMCELCGFKTDSKLKMGEQNKMKIDHMVVYHFQLRVDAVLPKEPPFNCPGELEGQWEGKPDGKTYQQCWNVSKKGKKTREDLVRHYLGTHGMLYKWTKDFTEDVKKGVEPLKKIMEKHRVEHALPKEMHARKFKLILETEGVEKAENEVLNKPLNPATRSALKFVKSENLVMKNDSAKLSSDTTGNMNKEKEIAIPSKPTQIKTEDLVNTDGKSWRFKCTFCIRKFVSQSAVDSHEKISHKVLFQANSKSNNATPLVKSEIQTQSGENVSKYKSQQRVVCDICLKSCCNRSYLVKHKKIKHGIDPNNENKDIEHDKSGSLSETSMDESDSSKTITEDSEIRKRKLESDNIDPDDPDYLVDEDEDTEIEEDKETNEEDNSNETPIPDQMGVIDGRLTSIKKMRFCTVQLTSAGFGGIYM